MQEILQDHHEVGDPRSLVNTRNGLDQSLIMLAASRGHCQLLKMVSSRQSLSRDFISMQRAQWLLRLSLRLRRLM